MAEIEDIDYVDVTDGDTPPSEEKIEIFDTFEFLESLKEAKLKLDKDRQDGWRQTNLYVFASHKDDNVDEATLFKNVVTILENKFGENCHVGAGSMEDAVASLETAYKVETYCMKKNITVEELILEHEQAAWEDEEEARRTGTGIANNIP